VDLDPLGAETIDAAAGQGGRFGEGDDDPSQAGREDGVDAGRRFPVVRTGLEGDVNGASARSLAGFSQGHDLGVGSAEGGVISLACEMPPLVDNDRSDHRVR
jgi:hypothetical protein